VTESSSRAALRELLDVVKSVEASFLSPAWGLGSPADVAEGARAVLHLLEAGLVTCFESDPDHPAFRRIVTPSRKLTGDNPDAIYYDAPVRPDRVYRVRGRTAGAVYVSITVEVGAADGSMGSGTAGVLNDTGFDVAADGSFEITVGGPPQARNWLGLAPGASRLTTRHYWERETPAAADPTIDVALRIEPVGPPGPPPAWTDAEVAAGIRRVATFVRSRTLGMGRPDERTPPAFVSREPNRFPPPISPGDFGLAAADAAYSMAPYVLGPDEALVMDARWPACRCANVCLWNRHMQTFDYVSRRTSLNRRQAVAGPDGAFRLVIAHRDPGVPNWLDTEGRPFGLVFWRFFLPEGAIATPQARVVPLADVADR
jgi:hypothetical protein